MGAYKETKHFKKLGDLALYSKEIISSTYEENKPEVLSKVKDEYNIFDDDDEEADKLADEIFNGSATVSSNAPDDDEEGRKGKYTKARYLLLSLPTKDNCTGLEQTQAISRSGRPSGTEEQRMGEYREFIGAMGDPNICEDDIKVVKTKEGMFNSISQFLNEKDEAFANFIVFNGHGAGDRSPHGPGLCLAEETQNLSLDDVIRKIEVKSKDLKLGVVFIIFVQCYAHLHSPTDAITVVYFTSMNKPKTVSMIRQGTYTHSELTKWAKIKNVAQGSEYLLLSAPHTSDFDEDTKLKQRHYENFIADATGEISTQPVLVKRWGHMQCAIMEFLRIGNSQRAIIFYGCACEDGLMLHEDKTIKLDKVVQEVAELGKTFGLRQEVRLIFTQCFACLYPNDDIEGIDNCQVDLISSAKAYSRNACLWVLAYHIRRGLPLDEYLPIIPSKDLLSIIQDKTPLK